MDPQTMASRLPTDDEIMAFAVATGNVDEDGRFRVSRARLAAGAAKWADERAAEHERAERSTARTLADFLSDLNSEGIVGELARDIIIAVAPAVVRRDGLSTRENGPATHE